MVWFLPLCGEQQGFRNYEMGFMALLHLCVSEDFTLEDPDTWGGLTTKLLGNYNLPEKALQGSPRRSPMQRGGRGVSTDHTGVVRTCVSSAFFFLATCILCPLSVAVVVHAADRARRPETRNDRPLTEREQMIYHKAFLQDLSLLYAFLKDRKRHFVAWLNSRRFGITEGEIPKFELPEDDFVPTELEPYTDADMFRCATADTCTTFNICLCTCTPSCARKHAHDGRNMQCSFTHT
jgi:hypothetical protein